MRVFISWSGEISHQAAIRFHDWLPSVLPFVKPWVSSEDIAKGSRWGSQLADELETTNCGILCVTPANLREPWLNFEAGALSKAVAQAQVHPFLLGIRSGDLIGPFSQFQATVFARDEVRQLTRAINAAAKSEALSRDQADRHFETHWADLHLGLALLVEQAISEAASPNLVRNSNLVHNTNYWGTGYIETLVTNGNFPADFTKQYPLVLSGKAEAVGRRDTLVYPPGGYASFFIQHYSGKGDHVWSSFSQSITGLRQDTDYIAAFKIKAEHAERKAVFLTLDTRWAKPHRYADPGQYDWRRIELPPFNTGKKDFVEFRFVIQDRAKVWLADFELYERPKPIRLVQ